MPPARSSLRRELRLHAPSLPELQAFIVDYFPEVARRISPSMERLTVENLLLESVSEEGIARAIADFTQPDARSDSPQKPEPTSQAGAAAGPAGAEAASPRRIVCLVASRDLSFYEQLRVHVEAIAPRAGITLFSAFDVPAGSLPTIELQREIARATLILCLISVDFLTDKQQAQGLDLALARHQQGQARLLPLLIRPALLEATPLAGLQALPRNGKPISLWANRDEAWIEVVREIDRSLRPSRSD